eukprot:TRINITY_DN62735_c0_g1_i1.p1 TRINITY_DN62735_c0_g1~~TRINITY_DN62735_c0_g1_i1.p1  ORF type:complete len:259 (-),score=28.73 TRINITY_DN62735_c0_g1_i1:84-860(-)
MPSSRETSSDIPDVKSYRGKDDESEPEPPSASALLLWLAILPFVVVVLQACSFGVDWFCVSVPNAPAALASDPRLNATIPYPTAPNGSESVPVADSFYNPMAKCPDNKFCARLFSEINLPWYAAESRDHLSSKCKRLSLSGGGLYVVAFAVNIFGVILATVFYVKSFPPSGAGPEFEPSPLIQRAERLCGAIGLFAFAMTVTAYGILRHAWDHSSACNGVLDSRYDFGSSFAHASGFQLGGASMSISLFHGILALLSL